MSVERLVERVVAILGNVEHASTEVLGTVHSLRAENFKQATSDRVLDRIEGLLESSGGRSVNLVAKSRGTVLEAGLGNRVSSQIRQTISGVHPPDDVQ